MSMIFVYCALRCIAYFAVVGLAGWMVGLFDLGQRFHNGPEKG